MSALSGLRTAMVTPMIASLLCGICLGEGLVLKRAVSTPDGTVSWDAGKHLKVKDRSGERILVECFYRKQAWVNEDQLISSDQALAYFTRQAQLNPNNTEILAARAGELIENEKFDEALQVSTRAIRINPRDWLAYYHRAYVHEIHTGDNNQAIEDYTEAMNLRPKESKIVLSRGRTFSDSGNFVAAETDLSRAVREMPWLARAWSLRANNRMNMNRFDGALADLNKALSIDPDFAEAYALRGEVRILQRSPAAALPDLNKAASLCPDASWVYVLRGAARLKTNDSNGSLLDFSRAYELDPTLNEEDYMYLMEIEEDDIDLLPAVE